MTIYLDASVLVPLLVTEASSSAVEVLVDEHSGELVVSEYAAAETASALSRLTRTHVMSVDRATMLLKALDAWRSDETEIAELDASDMYLASAYVRQFDLMLRVPDAMHIALCYGLELTLATLDQRLAKAARSLGVKVAIPRAQG